MSILDLDAIRARTEAADAGPWHAHPTGQFVYNLDAGELATIAAPEHGPANARFIAHARTDIPALLAEVDRLNTVIEKVRELHAPVEGQVLTGDCAVGECEHEADECPTVAFTYCAACHEIVEHANTYYAEEGMAFVSRPCPTITALGGVA